MRHNPRHLARKLVHLHPREWRDLIRAQAALVRAQFRVWLRPRGQLVSPSTDPNGFSTPPVDIPSPVQRLATAVDRVARYGVLRPKCLVQALALHDLLETQGFSEARVRVGVVNRNGRFVAHAWVEYRGAVLGDQDWYVKRFDPLTGLEVHRDR